MKTLNSRLLAVLLAGVVVFGTGVIFLHAFQVRRNAYVFWQAAQRAKERAEEAKKAKDPQKELEAYVEALKNLNWYLALRSDDLDALEEYGLMMADRGQYSQAFSVLEKLLRLAPERNHVRRKVVEFAMELGQLAQYHADATERVRRSARWFSVAREHLQNYLLRDSPDDGELLVLLGRCQAFAGDATKAAESFRRAIKNAPAVLEVYPRLAALLRQSLNRPQEADQCMRDLVKANPKSYQARLLAGNYLKDINALDEAMQESLRAMELSADNRDALLLAAEVALEKAGSLTAEQRSEAAADYYYSARDYIQRAVKAYPDNAAVYNTLAEVQQRSGDPEGAAVSLRTGLKATGNDSQLAWHLANLLIETGQVEEAQRTIELLRVARYPAALLGYLHGRIEYVQGHWHTAIEGFEKVRGGLEPWPQVLKQVDLALGRCYGRLGNPDQEQAALRRALAIDPSFSQARAALTDSLMSTGRVDDALTQYRQILKGGQTPPGGWLPLIRLLILKNEQSLPGQRNWQQVETLMEVASQSAPDSVQLAMLRAEAAAAQDRLQEAETLLLEGRRKSPEDPTFWSALVLLALRQADWDKAKRLLDEAKQKLGDKLELRLAWANYLVRRFGAEAGEQLRELAERTESFSDDERLQLWNGLLNVALQVGDSPQMEWLCRRVAEKDPNNVQARYLLFEIARRTEDPEALQKPLEAIRKIEGTGPMWHYCEAARLAMLAKPGNDKLLDQALQHIAKTREARPNWSRVPLLAAGIYDRQGKQDLAMENLRKAVDMGERSEAAIRRLVQLYSQRNRYADAQEMLRLLGDRKTSLSGELDRMRTSVELQLGNLDSARDIAAKTAAKSRNFQDHVWLALILETCAQRSKTEQKPQEAEKLLAEAEKALRRAVALADKNPAAWLPLIKFLAGTAQTRKAEEALEQARANIPAERAPLALAQAYETLGQAEQAQAKYEEALAAAAKDPLVVRTVADYYWRSGKPKLAEAQLRRMLDGKVPTQQSDMVWARYILAKIWGSQGKYQDIQKALQLIEQNLAIDKSSAQDQQLKAFLLASQPTRAKREEAAQALETLREWQSATPEDKLALAELYRVQGDWTKFTAQMRNLLAAHGDDPHFLVFYIGALLQHNEVQTAEGYLARLEKVAPEQFATTRLRAEILFRREQHEEARQLLKSFLDKPDGLPADHSTRLRLVGETLEKLSQRLTASAQKSLAASFRRDAEMMFRQYVDQRTGQETLLVDFLTRQGRISDALDVLEKIWATNNPTDVARVFIDLVKSPDASQEDLRRGEKIVRAGLQKLERPVALLKVMAVLCTRQQRYPEAESYYREIIRKNPEETVPLNNLAVLLAMQGKGLDEALQLVNKAIELAGPVPSMLDSRASVYLALRQPEKALADLKEAIADAAAPIRLFHQAQAYHLLGNKQAAAKVLAEANKAGLKPESLEPLERPIYQELQKVLQ